MRPELYLSRPTGRDSESFRLLPILGTAEILNPQVASTMIVRSCFETVRPQIRVGAASRGEGCGTTIGLEMSEAINDHISE